MVLQYIAEIVDLWNKGEKEKSKKLFMKYQWVLPKKTNDYFKDKMKLKYDCNLKGIYYYNETNIKKT